MLYSLDLCKCKFCTGKALNCYNYYLNLCTTPDYREGVYRTSNHSTSTLVNIKVLKIREEECMACGDINKWL